MDDLKISYVDEGVVTNIIKELSNRFGDIMPLSINRGKIHDYLGMTFDYSTYGKLMIAMYDYINGLIRNAGIIYKEVAGSATPAPDNLYDIRSPESEEYKLLSKEKK